MLAKLTILAGCEVSTYALWLCPMPLRKAAAIVPLPSQTSRGAPSLSLKTLCH